MTPSTILVVEDNPVVRKMLRVTLATEGYRVVEAADAATALELAVTRRPDLIVQDLVLPDLDGRELVGRLRALPGLDAVPILACSGFLSRMEEIQARPGGFDDFLAKPVQPSELLRAVRAFLGEGRSEAGPGRARRIVLVDDAPVQLKLGRLRMEAAGFRVAVAADGVEALELVRRDPPDAVVSDIMMPRLDGFGLCLAIRRDPALAAIPVVLATNTYLDEEDDQVARSMGASDIVVRTPDFATVIEAVALSLAGGPPPLPAGDVEALQRSHVHRIILQLEKQAALAASLSRRSSSQAAALAILSSISDALIRGVDSQAEIDRILADCMEAAGVSPGALYAVEGDRLVPRVATGYQGLAAGELEQCFGHERLFSRALESGKPLAVPSPALDPETARAFLARTGAASALIVPLVFRGERLGVLLLGSELEELADRESLDFGRAMGAQLGQAMALVRSFARVAAAEAEYRSIVERAVDGIFRADAEGRLLVVNPAMARIFGHDSPAEMVAAVKHIPDHLAVDPDRRRQLLHGLRADGRVSDFEIQALRRDGNPIWVALNVRARAGASGEVTGYDGLLQDITHRKRAEAASAALAGLAQALSGSRDDERIADLVTGQVRELLGAQSAVLYRLEPDSGLLRLMTVSGDSDETGYYWTPVLGPELGLAPRSLRERRPLASPDTLNDPEIAYRPEDRARLARARHRAVLCIPMLVGEREFGVLAVGDRTGRSFEEREVRLVQGFAAQAALALHNAQLLADSRSRQARLEALLEASRHLSGSLDFAELGQRIVTSVRELLGACRAALYLLDDDGTQRLATESNDPRLPATPSFDLPPGGGLLGLALNENQAMVTSDLLAEPRIVLPADLRGYLERTGLGAFVAAPLRGEGRLIGGLVVGDRPGRQFTAEELAIVEAFAAHASAALANARLFQESASASARLRHLLEATPTVVYSARPSGDHGATYVSPNVREQLGYTAEEFVADPRFWADRLHPEDAPGVLAGLPAALERGQHRHEYRFRHRDGTWRWMLDEFRVVRDGAGQPVELVGHWMDITERKQAEAALRESEKLAAMGSLLAGVAHELNNPLSVVLGQSRLLQERPQVRPGERAEAIARAAERCARIVKNFLALARRRPTERQAVVLADVVHDALELVAYPLRVDSVEVQLDLAPDLPVLWADPHQLHQVVVNLITNAHHALRATGGIRRIGITAAADPTGRRVVLEVADSGPGIPEAVRSRLFEPFFTTKPAGEGTGLGLALCRGIVESHEGTITVRNSAEGGAVFRVELPVRPPAARALPPDPDGPAQPAAGPSRILVVDDEVEIARLLAEVVAMDGHQVDVVNAGEAALDRVRSRHYDLVLSDLRMPGLGGPDLYHRLAALGFPVASRVAFITGDVLKDETREFLETTGAVCISKPFSTAQLRAGIQQALARAGGGQVPR